jgi:hypothetical protein
LPLAAAHALCDGIQPCCAQVGYAYDGPTCLANAQAELQQEISDESGKGGIYDANAAGACVAQLRAQAGACANPPPGSTMTDCPPIYVGTKKMGEACTQSADCAASPDGRLECSTTTTLTGTGTQTSSGICVLFKNTAAKGDPCGGSSSSGMPLTVQANCESNDSPLYCDFANTHTCIDRIAIGQPCNGSGCAIGAYCNAGTCAADLAEGATCSYGNCATGLYCNMTSVTSGMGTCTKEKNAGDACTSGLSNSCASGTCSMGKCSAGSLATADACKGGKSSTTVMSDGGAPTLPDAG